MDKIKKQYNLVPKDADLRLVLEVLNDLGLAVHHSDAPPPFYNPGPAPVSPPPPRLKKGMI